MRKTKVRSRICGGEAWNRVAWLANRLVARLGIVLLAGLVLLASAGGRPASLARAAESSPEAVAEFANAAEIQNNEQFELAALEWEKFLSNFPEDPLAVKARHYLGVCRMQLKQYDEAAKAFSQVTEAPEFEFVEDALLNLGWCQHMLGKAGAGEMHDAAVATLSKLNQQFPTGKFTDQALYFLGESHYAKGRLSEAAKAYYSLVKDHPRSSLRPDGLYAYGVAVEEQKQHKTAGEIYSLFLREFPEHRLAGEVSVRQAESVLQQGDAAAAEKLFAAAAARPNFALADHARMRQAFCLVKQEKFAAAGDLYAAAAQAADKLLAAEAMASAGRSYYRAKQFDAAAEWFDKAIAAGGPDVAEATHWRCRIWLMKKQPDKALAAAQQALTSAEGEFVPALKVDLADALYETPQRRKEAVDLYLAIARDHADRPEAAQSLYNAAFGALELRSFDQARELATRFIEAHPDHVLAPDVRYVLAESELQSGRPAQAEAAYRALLSQFPQHAERLRWTTRLALALYAQKKYREAEETARPLIRDGADAAATEALFIAGASRFHQNDFSGAQALLERVLAADPDFRQADETLLLLSRCAHKQEQLDKAVELVRKLIAQFPDSRLLDQARFRHGEYLYAQEKYAEAESEYALCATTWPESSLAPFALYGQGWSQLKQGKHAAAIEAFTELVTRHGQSSLAADALTARATCRRLSGDFAGAIADIGLRLESPLSGDQKASALYERGLAEAGMKNFAAASATFAEILKGNPDFASADKVLYEQGWAFKSLDKQAEAVATFAALVERFPRSPFAAEAKFHLAEAVYAQGDYAKAAESYSGLLTQLLADAQGGDPASSELGEKAAHKLGWSYFQSKQYEQATGAFQKELEHWPSGALAADARFMLAECLFKQEKYEPALAAFDSLAEARLSSEALADLASLHAGQSAAQLGQWSSSITRLTALIERHPDSVYAAEALYEIGHAQSQLGETDKALKSFDKAAAKELALLKGRGKVSARAYFMAGELHFQNKRFKEAILQFQRVVYGKFVEDVAGWREKSAYEAARCAEVQIASASSAQERSARVADARKSYEWLLKNFPESPLAAEGKKRLAELGAAGAP